MVSLFKKKEKKEILTTTQPVVFTLVNIELLFNFSNAFGTILFSKPLQMMFEPGKYICQDTPPDKSALLDNIPSLLSKDLSNKMVTLLSKYRKPIIYTEQNTTFVGGNHITSVTITINKEKCLFQPFSYMPTSIQQIPPWTAINATKQ